MRKLTSTLFITLDGVVGGEKEMSVWHFPYFSDELGAAAGGAYDPADTILLGRVTYDSFAGAWPEREKAGEDDAAFAAQLGDTRKVVVSRRQLTFEWRNSEQLQGDLIEGVKALKSEPGQKGIVIPGSVSVVRELLIAGLVDELHLMVHPVIMRTGLRLFDHGEPPVHLELLSSQSFDKGVLNLVYKPIAAPGAAGYEQAQAHLPQTEP